MTFVQLSYILAIEQYGSFQKASEASFVTQPTLSMQVKKLEEEFETILFDRSIHPVQPTTEGRVILNIARDIIRRHDELLDTALSFQDTLVGTIKLGIIPTIIPYLTYRFIPYFRKKYPRVKLSIDELVTDDIIAGLRHGELDAGIMATPVEKKGIVEYPLYYEDFTAYVSPDHSLYKFDKLNSFQISTDGLWLLKDGHCFRDQIINLCHTNTNVVEKYDVEFRTDSFNSIFRLIDTEGGYTLLPVFAHGDLDESHKKHLRYFNPPVPQREVSLCSRKGYPGKSLLEALKHSIQKNIPAAMQQRRGDIIPINPPPTT
ncbi:MAG: LysR substrate-binding domain-containing protein [Bacteroidales bacterium]